MEITEIRPEDASKLAELDKLCFSVPWSEKSFAEESQNPIATYFVAREDGQVIGYGGFWTTIGEAQITNIAVHPNFRKKGVASKILEEILESAACESFVLEVRKSNTAAISLYEKYGFLQVGERKNFYHSPVENAIIMIRSNG